MNLTRYNFDFAALDADRLQGWFPAGDLAEISARWGDATALIAYLSRVNDLTPEETEEMILDLAWVHAAEDGALRAA
ncbi:MAG: hypothetical protein OIF48_16815 [Silicimonas sp.]|nr:hypothetical protein [Silicimonas sp.]